MVYANSIYVLATFLKKYIVLISKRIREPMLVLTLCF